MSGMGRNFMLTENGRTWVQRFLMYLFKIKDWTSKNLANFLWDASIHRNLRENLT